MTTMFSKNLSRTRFKNKKIVIKAKFIRNLENRTKDKIYTKFV